MTKYDLVSIIRPTAEDSLVEEIHKNITEIIKKLNIVEKILFLHMIISWIIQVYQEEERQN